MENEKYSDRDKNQEVLLPGFYETENSMKLTGGTKIPNTTRK